MNIKIQVKTNIELAKIIQLSKAYFLDEGFKLKMEKANFLCFTRGSLARNSVTFYPLKWKCKIELWLEEGKMKAHFNIDTIFQEVTSEEEQLWRVFIRNYRKTIETGVIDQAENKKQWKATKKSTLKLLAWAFLFAIITGILEVILSSFFN